MSRRVCLALFLVASLEAAVLPETFGSYSRQSVSAIQLQQPEVWLEFELKSSERAVYSRPDGRSATIESYGFADPTGAYAAHQWQRRGQPHNNYLLVVAEGELAPDELGKLKGALPNQISSSLPALTGYLPAKGRVFASERYVLGSTALAAFEPRLPGHVVDFNLGAEAQIARYKRGSSEVQLVLVSYPTPQMAAKRLAGYQGLAEAAVVRKGPLVAVAFPRTPAADALLSEIAYEPKITWAEAVSSDTPQDAANMILAIFVLAGVLIGASVLFGLAFGGFRVAKGRFGMRDASEGFTSLNLDGK